MRHRTARGWAMVGGPLPDAETSRFTLGLGAAGAIVLGAALTMVRDWTSASNLAFVFLLWTIIVAELGGRAAALATAVTSALSLNFFLTRPYLTLVIDDPDDLIAFVALAVCGLVAAAFGRRRQAADETLRDVRSDLEIIDRISYVLGGEPKRADRLVQALEKLRHSLHLRGVVLRDAAGRVVATADPEGLQGLPQAPLEVQAEDWLAARVPEYRFGARGLRLPPEGGRVPLRVGGELVGMLDVWEGDPAGFDQAQYQTLTVVARLIGAALATPR